jgi:DNA invertase Pin-like site-specific DNA recombinase
MKVIAYTRVSTDKQAEQGYGLDVQRKAIRAWAKAGGHKVTAWYSDEGLSGSNGLDTRPGLSAAFSALETGAADALVVGKLDRLARKLVSQETWIERVEQAGRKVISVAEPDHGEDEMRVLIRQVLGAFAEYERAVIRKRLAGGRAEKAAQGGYAYGGPPYGWRAEAGELVRESAEQDVLAEMRELRDGGLSFGAVATRLNERGLRARRGQWHAQTVSRALARATAPQEPVPSG